MKRGKTPSLKAVQKYSNPRVIAKFREAYYFGEAETADLFNELLSWLWLVATAPDGTKSGMYHPMQAMDKMWHTFISFTKDYADFCEKYFGKFIHHEPHTRADAAQELVKAKNPALVIEKMREDIESFQVYTYDKLGANALVKWFVTYPHMYSPEELQRRTRPLYSQHGLLHAQSMLKMNKADLLAELSKNWIVAAWCGGPNCGPQCEECRGGGGGNPPTQN